MINESELKKHLSSSDLSSLYLFTGDEPYLKRLYLRKLVSCALGEGTEEFNYDVFDGKNTDLSDVFDLALQFPMMSEKRCIVVDDYKFDSSDDSLLIRIEEAFSTLPESTVLIFYQDTYPIAKKGNGKKLLDLFQKHGLVVSLNKRSGEALVKPLISFARKNGCILERNTALYFVDRVGDDFNTVINELSKVCSFVGEGTITEESIDTVATTTLQTKIFLLTDYLLSGNLEKAFEVYDILVRQKTEAEYILGVIVSSFVDLYCMRASFEAGVILNEAIKRLDAKKKEYGLKKALQRSRRISMPVLRGCLDTLYEADMKLKRARDNPMIIIEELMIKLDLAINGGKSR